MRKHIFSVAVALALVILGPVVAFAADSLSIPSSTATQGLAFVQATLADAGVLAVLIVAVGVPLAFYVGKKIIGLFPKR